MPHQRLKPETFLDEERLAAFKDIIPEAFADNKINWSTLKDALGGEPEDEEKPDEHFGLFWPGKREARKLASRPSKGTLIPVKGEGVKEETTRNNFIEGENLEVLKILRKSYTGRIKMIYIDPPYNTGNDFVYDDDFTEPLNDYLKRTGQIDGEGRPLTTNKKADGRFYSKWLSMMYPRLRLARELLRDDGVIFVSIDDNEVHHLRMMMNEVFGEENHIADFICNTEGHSDNQFDIKINHESILLYSKNSDLENIGFVVDPNTREESNLWKGYAENSITKNGPKNPPSTITLPVGFPCLEEELFLEKTDVPGAFFKDVEATKFISRQITSLYGVTYPIRIDDIHVNYYRLEKSCAVFSGWANADKLKKFIINGCLPIDEPDGHIKFYLSKNGVIYYRKARDKAKNILSVLRNMGTTEKMRAELENDYGIPFQYPKPKELLSYLIDIGITNGIVLDFFAGSGTTGHSIIEYKDTTKIKYILVQLPQELNSLIPEQKTGYDFCIKNNLHANISSITKERIRRVIKKIESKQKEELPALSGEDGEMDLGFKVFKLTSSNYKPWENYHGESIEKVQELFEEYEVPLVDNWKEVEDGLFTEILLLEGFPLDSIVTEKSEYTKNQIRQVKCSFHENSLLVCLDYKLASETIQSLELADGDTFVCLDTAIDDQAKSRLADKGMIKTI